VKQVAQLWQKDRAKLASFSINVQLYSQNHKIAFLSYPIRSLWEHQRQALYLKVLTQKNFVAEFYRDKQQTSAFELSFRAGYTNEG